MCGTNHILVLPLESNKGTYNHVIKLMGYRQDHANAKSDNKERMRIVREGSPAELESIELDESIELESIELEIK